MQGVTRLCVDFNGVQDKRLYLRMYINEFGNREQNFSLHEKPQNLENQKRPTSRLVFDSFLQFTSDHNHFVQNFFKFYMPSKWLKVYLLYLICIIKTGVIQCKISRKATLESISAVEAFSIRLLLNTMSKV